MRRDANAERERSRRREERKRVGEERRIRKRALAERKKRRRHDKQCKVRDRRRTRLIKKKYGRKAHNACTSKKYYHTKKGAMSAARCMERMFDGTYTAYKCDFCDGWHLTTHGYGGENEAVRDPREVTVLGY